MSGSGTRSSLMYETIRIFGKLKPKYVIWENVKNLLSKKHRHNFDNYLDKMSELGYRNYYQVLNAKDYGIPQNRERVFTISIRNDIHKDFHFPEKKELKLRLKDMLEPEVDEKYYLSDKIIKFYKKNEEEQKAKGNGFTFGVSDGNKVARAITTRAGSRMDDNFIKIKNATKQGYDIATNGDSINLQYPKSTTRRGRVGHQVSQTLQGNSGIGVVIKTIKTKNKRILKLAESLPQDEGAYFMDIYNQKILKDETTTLKAGMDWQQGNIVSNKLRIRKLTPKECWRLMRIQRRRI